MIVDTVWVLVHKDNTIIYESFSETEEEAWRKCSISVSDQKRIAEAGYTAQRVHIILAEDK